MVRVESKASIYAVLKATLFEEFEIAYSDHGWSETEIRLYSMGRLAWAFYTDALYFVGERCLGEQYAFTNGFICSCI